MFTNDAPDDETLMNDGFALLHSKIILSSLWVTESKETRLVWITMLALKEKNGIVRGSVVGLADAAKVTAEECRDSLERLLSPDENDSSGVMEGRRLVAVDGGWQIVNHERYRASERREQWRRAQHKYRSKKKDTNENPDDAAF